MPKRPLRHFVARAFLAATGWKPEGVRPDVPRYVMIAAPHTSNWDFAYLLAFAEYFEIEMSWIGKHTLFKPPIGFIMRALGGIPVRRDKRENVVTSLARVFEDYEELGLAVPAEGTRSHVDHWKSGFYHIAREAEVPIIMSFLDYERKVGGFGLAFYPSGNLREDMDVIRAFYSEKKGKFPELFGTIRLLEEDSAKTDSEE